jgi:hypothetical protein
MADIETAKTSETASRTDTEFIAIRFMSYLSFLYISSSVLKDHNHIQMNLRALLFLAITTFWQRAAVWLFGAAAFHL